LLVLADEHSAKASGGLKMRLVLLALNSEIGGHINQVARRSELAGHLPGDEAIVKIQRYRDAPPSLAG